MSAGGESNIQENKVSPKCQKASERHETLPFPHRGAVGTDERLMGTPDSALVQSRRSVSGRWSWPHLSFSAALTLP